MVGMADDIAGMTAARFGMNASHGANIDWAFASVVSPGLVNENVANCFPPLRHQIWHAGLKSWHEYLEHALQRLLSDRCRLGDLIDGEWQMVRVCGSRTCGRWNAQLAEQLRDQA